MATDREVLLRLMDAASMVLDNIIDGGTFGPEPCDAEDAEANYIQDGEGDWWYIDVWKLTTALSEAANHVQKED